jgi:hypothetical protein
MQKSAIKRVEKLKSTSVEPYKSKKSIKQLINNINTKYTAEVNIKSRLKDSFRLIDRHLCAHKIKKQCIILKENSF